MPSSERIPTPTELRTLAARLAQATADIAAAEDALRVPGDEPTRKVGWRLADAAGAVRRAARAVGETADDLEFIGRVRSRQHCLADWGCCPEHGATLTGSGGRCRCMKSGCGRSWDSRRMNLPCDEPPAFRLIDAEGKGGLVCAGHAVAAREQLIGGRLLPLDSDPGEEGDEGHVE